MSRSASGSAAYIVRQPTNRGGEFAGHPRCAVVLRKDIHEPPRSVRALPGSIRHISGMRSAVIVALLFFAALGKAAPITTVDFSGRFYDALGYHGILLTGSDGFSLSPAGDGPYYLGTCGTPCDASGQFTVYPGDSGSSGSVVASFPDHRHRSHSRGHGFGDSRARHPVDDPLRRRSPAPAISPFRAARVTSQLRSIAARAKYSSLYSGPPRQPAAHNRRGEFARHPAVQPPQLANRHCL